MDPATQRFLTDSALLTLKVPGDPLKALRLRLREKLVQNSKTESRKLSCTSCHSMWSDGKCTLRVLPLRRKWTRHRSLSKEELSKNSLKFNLLVRTCSVCGHKTKIATVKPAKEAKKKKTKTKPLLTPISKKSVKSNETVGVKKGKNKKNKTVQKKKGGTGGLLTEFLGSLF